MPEKSENITVCMHHWEFAKNLQELNNRVDYISKVKWQNGEEKIIPLNKAVELILADMRDIKKNTELVIDSAKLFSMLLRYFKKHKVILLLLFGFILFILNKYWFTDFIMRLIKNFF